MKKRMKILLLLFACMILPAGCKQNVGTSEDNPVAETSGQEEAVEEKQQFRFGFTFPAVSGQYYSALEQSIRAELEKQGSAYTLLTKEPAADAGMQEQQIDELIEAQVDAVFISPVDWEEIMPSVEALHEAGILAVNLDTPIKDVEQADIYVGTDNKLAGRLCGEDLIERFPEGGKAVLLESSLFHSVAERMTGFEEAIANEGFEILERADTDGTREAAKAEMSRILSEQEEIDVIMCGNDEMALGALEAVREAGRSSIRIYGVDGSPEMKQELTRPDSQAAGTAAQSPISIGQHAVEAALQALQGEDHEDTIYEEAVLINSENVELYGVDGWQ